MTQTEIEALADRLEARAKSRLTDGCKIQRSDLNQAAKLLREYGQTKVTPETEQPFAPVPVV